jgi:glycosyltransferase involved in cell wall biosynthesis
MQDGENGLIIGPNDPDALTIRLRTLAEDSNLRERLGSAGRVAVQPYTWQETTRQTMAVYEKFLAEKP